jgi:hypothetical protein
VKIAPFIGDAGDVGRAVTHHATIVGADVPVDDVIGHDDQMFGFGCCAAAETITNANDASKPIQTFLLMLPINSGSSSIVDG